MKKHQSNAQGFVLIAALLLMFLLSGVAVGVMMLTNSEVRIGSNDKESQLAYYGAESGMEKLTSDLAALYAARQSPSNADLQALVAPGNAPNAPMVGQMTYGEMITYPLDQNGNPAAAAPDIISSGPNQGLTALILPMTLTVNATRPSNASVNMIRNVEVALIPVFQFGMFSHGDMNFSNGATFTFGGRVHTNGNLFLTTQAGGNTIFGSKITVVGEVLRDPMQNSFPVGSTFNGSVFIPKATAGCDPAIAALRAPLSTETNCISFGPTSASWFNTVPPVPSPSPSANANSSWLTISTVNFGGFIGNPRSTGVKPLVLPFVAGGGLQSDIIRRPLPNELATSSLGQSRLYNKANIRILLADTLVNLHQDGSAAANADGQDVSLAAISSAAPAFGTGGVNQSDAVAYADPSVDTKWIAPNSAGVATAKFPLITGYLRVEYKDTNDIWHGITNEWLGFGIGRGVSPVGTPNPTAASVGAPNPNAILIFQELASTNLGVTYPTRLLTNLGTNWYPINFYDPREGQVREANSTTTQCTINGLLNAVELDMGNLTKWTKGLIGVTGPLAEHTEQNGYVLYFSDRRGMLPNPRANAADKAPANVLNGEYGFEDVVNIPASTTGLPNGVDGGIPEPGEDVNASGQLDTYGAANVGDGFRVATNTAGYPYADIDCLNQGRMNRVTGARHVLRLVDGKLGNLPLTNTGAGLSVASENPVYIYGDYNAGNGQGLADTGHSPSAVMADAVTLLSNNWNDINDMTNPSNAWNRGGSTTYYRTAIAGGNNLAFANPTGANGNTFGADGGVNNFLRYIEDWGSSGATLWYSGSMVSLYPSQYATGVFKFGQTAVYNAPNRKYSFDTLFLNPATLPPATPMFQDVVNLSYRQDFRPQ